MADVICSGCAGRYHETTDQYTDERSPHGGMFRLKEPFKSNGWESFPEHIGVTGECLECPNCGSPYVGVNNRVKLEAEPEHAGEEDALLLKLDAEGKTPAEIGESMGKSHQWVGKNLKRLRES